MPNDTFPINTKSDVLNENQLKAVCHDEGPLIIVAGAGTGKTRVLTHRIAYLIDNGSKPENILAVTFTNKAANEMKGRVASLVSAEDSKLVWIGTFHNICVRILRHDIKKLKLRSNQKWSNNFVIYDENDSVELIKKCINALELDNKVYVPKNIKAFISSLKCQGYEAHSFGDIAKNHREIKISEIFDLYQKELEKNNALDFDDLLLYTVKLLEENDDVRNYYHKRFKHVLVDEFQDTNLIQYELVRLIAEGVPKYKRDEIDKIDGTNLWHGRSFAVVGDVDQSIYSWRGADFRIILGFQKDFPENTLIKLEQNYRSTEIILKVADAIIKNNKERIEKVLVPTKTEGTKIICFEAENEKEEALYVAEQIFSMLKNGYKFTDVGILYRTNAQSRAIEEALIKKSVPYQIFGGFRFYERKEIKDVIAYLKVIYNPSDSVSLKRIINVPKRGLGATTIEKIEKYSSDLGFTLYKSLLEISDVPNISEKVVQSVKKFTDLLELFRKASKSLSITDLLTYILKESGYYAELEEEGTLEAEDRMANIQELFSVASEFESNYTEGDISLDLLKDELGGFLTQISLYTDLDKLNQISNKVTLMTLHLAKGLEYPIVFICGLEEGIFPHVRSIDSLDATELEEERRLMYVGVTRAKEHLYFTHASERQLFGQTGFSEVSRFVGEAPKEYLNRFFGGLDEKVSARRKSISKKGITRKYSDYEVDEMIAPKEAIKNKEPRKIFNVGDKVKHHRFGDGVVEQVFGTGNKLLVNVNFKERGKKLLDPRYAKLIKL